MAALLGSLLCGTSMLAQIWTGATDATWSTAGNWTGGVPGTAATATFNSTTPNDPNLTGAAAVGQVLFASGADAEIFTGLALTLNGVSTIGLDNQSGLTQTFNNTLIVATAQTWNATSGNLAFSAVTLNNNLSLTGAGDFTFSGSLLLNGGSRTLTNDAAGTVLLAGGITGNTRTLTVAGSGDTAITGAITTTTGGLNKTGTGTLTLSGANTNTGATTVGTAAGTSGGTLRLGAANILANATTTVFAGTLDLNNHDDTIGALTLGGGAAGTTATVTTGSGTLTLGGNVTYTNTNNPDGATIAGNLALGGANRTFTVGNSTAVTDDLLISAVISGTNALNKAGTGTLVLTGANTYTGATNVNAGVLNIRHADALGTTAAGTTVTTGEELQLQGGIAVGAEALNLTGSGVSNTGALRNISGTNSYAGALTLAGATRITADAGALTLSGGITAGNQALTLAGAGDLTLSGAMNLGSATLTKLDAGALTLSGTNSSTGATTIGTAGGTATGTVQLGAANALASGTLTLYAGTVDLNNFNDTIGALTLGGGAAGTTATVTTGSGTLTLGGNVTYTNTNNPNGASISGLLDLGGANRTFNVGNSTAVADDLVIAAVISGANAITKTGTGTLVFTGANTYTGATNINAGVLNIRHSDALGTTAAGTTVTTGEELQLQGGIAVGAEALNLTGTGVSNTGALRNISGTNSYAGLVTLAGATRITADAGALTLSGGITAANQALTVAGAGDLTLSGAMNLGSATLTKLDAGNLTLAGTNSSTGTTTIGTAGGATTGTVQLGAANGLASGTLTLYAGTVDLNNFNDTIGALALGGGATGTTATVATGSGTLTLGGNVSYSATNNTNGATISGQLDLGGANRTFNIGNSTAVVDDLVISADISGANAISKITSGGTLVLSGANTYSGATTVSNGVLNLRSGSALGATTAGTTVSSGAALELQGGINVGAEALSVAGTGVGGTGALRNISGSNTYGGVVTLANTTQIAADAGDLTLSGGITGANRTLTLTGAGDFSINGITTGTGSLNHNGSGTTTLTGASTYTGATTLNAGTLRLGADNLLSNSTAVTVASGATLDVNGFTDTIATLAGAGTVDFGSGGTLIAAGAGSTTFSGDLAGSGTFTKQGAGILTLTNDLTFAGTFNLAGGTLQLSNMTLALDTLNITGNSIIDFAGVSTLALTNFSISGGVTLTVQNWADASDFFFTQFWTGATLDVTGAAPMNQITFTGFPAADTKWQSYDRQVTPVPEPSTYGALLLATAGGLLAWRRRIRRRAA